MFTVLRIIKSIMFNDNNQAYIITAATTNTFKFVLQRRIYPSVSL